MNWIEGFLDYTAHIPSPEIFRQWAAISTIAGALERKTWVRSLGSNLYPNLYVILVAPPGIGKTEAVWRVRSFWKEVPELHVARSSVTKASLIDELFAANRSVVRPKEIPAVVTFNSLQVASNELGVLIPAYDNEFMNTLTDLYDCKTYSESRRTSKLQIDMEHTHLNILGACTPSYLNSVLPEGAWDQGFTSRVILVYSGEPLLKPLFAEQEEKKELRKELAKRLKDIAQLYGQFTITDEAKTIINSWYQQGGKPKPDHPKLMHYNTRRHVHVLKLCMVISASESNEMVINLEHLQRAFDLLFEAEFYMPDIFKSMASSGPGQLMEECWHFVYTASNKMGKAVPQARVVNFLSQRTPAHNVARVLEVMESAGLLKRQLGKAGNEYLPGGKG